MKSTLTAVLCASFLASASAAEFRAVAIKSVPSSAMLLTGPAAAASLPADVSSLVSPVPAASALIEGGAVVLSHGADVLVIPQTIRPGAQAVAIPKAGGEAQMIAIGGEAARAIKAALGKDDVEGAYRALGRTFDKSAAAAAGPDAAVAAAPAAAHAPSGLAQAKPKFQGAQPMPAAQEPYIQSEFADLDSAYDMYVSHSYPGKPASDPAKLVADAIDDYIAFKGMKPSEKHFVLKFFEIGDKMDGGHAIVVQAIERLVKAGVKTTVLTDFNQSATGVFPQDELHNTDFESLTYKKGGPGKALQYLREQLGFKLKYGEGKFTVLSGVPLFNPRDKGEKPLMHDKGYAALGPGGKAYKLAGNGTSNMNATEEKTDEAMPSYGGRYNRWLVSKDPAANQVDWEHIEAEIQTYNERKGPKGLPKELDAPRRVVYKSGEYREIAFTNGRQNPNDRITAEIVRATQALKDAKAAGKQPDFELDEIIFSHFVLTNSPEVDALRHYLDALRDFYPEDYTKRVKIFGVFDQQFISPDGFGLVGALDGVLVQRPMGKSIFPFRTEYLPMMELYGYVRLLAGADKIDPDSAPTKVHLWHDKTSMIKYRVRDPKTGQMVAWTKAWTRSFNNSGHFQSLESQDEYLMKPGSRLAQDFEDSIKKVAKAEKDVYAIDLDQVIAGFALAHATHHTIYDKDKDDSMLGLAKKAIAAMTEKMEAVTALRKAGKVLPDGESLYASVGAIVAQALAMPTRHAKGVVSPEVAQSRLGQFVGFMDWYARESTKDKALNIMTYRKAINVAIGLVTSAKNPWGLRTALDVLYWRFNLSEDKKLELMKKAWTDGLKMQIPFPMPKDKQEVPQA